MFASGYISGVPATHVYFQHLVYILTRQKMLHIYIYIDIINDYYLRIQMARKEPYIQDLQVPFTPEPRGS